MTTAVTTICSICLDPLTRRAFTPQQPDGDIALVCGAVRHVFHASCLEQWARTSTADATDTGFTVNHETVWSVPPPRCPECRGRFIAGIYWSGFGDVDAYPDNGLKYTATRLLRDWDPDRDADSSSDSDSGSAPTNSNNNNTGYNNYVMSDSGSGSDMYSSSEVDEPWDVHLACGSCGIEGPHHGHSAEFFISSTGMLDPICYVETCRAAILDTDDDDVLLCLNCNAVSHRHGR